MSSGKINAPTAGAVAAICLSAAWAVNGLFDTFSPAPQITEVTNENQISYPETDAKEDSGSRKRSWRLRTFTNTSTGGCLDTSRLRRMRRQEGR